MLIKRGANLQITHSLSKRLFWGVSTALLLSNAIGGLAQASGLPGSVDAGRIHADEYISPLKNPDLQDNAKVQQEEGKYLVAPLGSAQEKFVLKGISLEGISQYSEEEIKDIYRQDIGKEIALSRLWDIANAITNKYREDGYFLSRAYIPAQEIDGYPRIAVVEGYVSEVEFTQYPQGIKRLGFERDMKELLEKKPVNLRDIEGIILLLNDLPGYEFSSVLGLSSVQPKGEGAVKLSVVTSEEKKYSGEATLSNAGSKYLGPFVMSLGGKASVLPLQETDISLSLSWDRKEVKAASLSHKIPITLEDSLVLSLERSLSAPGDSLRVQDIMSTSDSASLVWNHNNYKSRKLTISSRVGLGLLRSEGEVMDTLLSRDNIRKLTIGADVAGGNSSSYYVFDLSLTKGLPILGGSSKWDENLSRPLSGSDFQKLESSLQVYYWLTPEWMTSLKFQGQMGSRSLPSSEEFGFGGGQIGRGYDGSELTGDHGAASSIEISYTGYQPLSGVSFRPYAFYDLGKVWNINNGQDSNVSASSGGLGLSGIFDGDDRLSSWRADTYIAKPLTHNIENPQQGGGDSLQLRFQLSKQF